MVGDGSCKLWLARPREDAAVGTVARSLSGGGASMAAVAFAEKSLRVATATAKGTVEVWGIVPRG